MAIPQNIGHDPFAQTIEGLAAYSELNSEIYFDIYALLTFGFIIGDGELWVECPIYATTWTVCG
jgi:hypothetical protein